eukprot:1366921-Amorphochlora_amoeboformis.AAC.3
MREETLNMGDRGQVCGMTTSARFLTVKSGTFQYPIVGAHLYGRCVVVVANNLESMDDVLLEHILRAWDVVSLGRRLTAEIK